MGVTGMPRPLSRLALPAALAPLVLAGTFCGAGNSQTPDPPAPAVIKSPTVKVDVERGLYKATGQVSTPSWNVSVAVHEESGIQWLLGEALLLVETASAASPIPHVTLDDVAFHVERRRDDRAMGLAASLEAKRRAKVLDYLGLFEVADAVPVIREAAGAADASVRKAACEALGRLEQSKPGSCAAR